MTKNLFSKVNKKYDWQDSTENDAEIIETDDKLSNLMNSTLGMVQGSVICGALNRNFVIFTSSSEHCTDCRFQVDEIACILRNSGCTVDLVDCNVNMMAWPKLLAKIPDSVSVKYRNTQVPLPQVFQGTDLHGGFFSKSLN